MAFVHPSLPNEYVMLAIVVVDTNEMQAERRNE